MRNYTTGRDDDVFAVARRLLGFAACAIMLVATVICLLLGFTAHPASAQTVAAATPATVDFGPLTAAVIEFVAPVLVSVGGTLGVWVLGRVLKWVGLKQDALHAQVIESGLEKAIGYAISKAGVQAGTGIPVNVKNEIVATAAGYATAMFPKALDHFKKSSQDIADMIEARLDKALAPPTLSADNLKIQGVDLGATTG